MNIKDANLNDFSSSPKKIMQIGEGNFLRAFADYFIQLANESGVINSSVVLVKPTKSKANESFALQDYRYNIFLRGRQDGKVVDDNVTVTCVSGLLRAYDDFDKVIALAKSPELEIIISNTTEAGIAFNKNDSFSAAPDVTYPAKLAVLLYERYKALGKDGKILILPVELIENNGSVLKKCVVDYAFLWNLDEGFIDYINSSCIFCSTLVDRIVTGFPSNNYGALCERLGYEDKLMVASEPYYSWIISADGREAEAKEIFPLDKIFDNIVWCGDVSAYRERKVRILNGAHTASVLAGYLAGYDIVRDMLHDELFRNMINLCLEKEVMPTIDLPFDTLKAFADSVLERFDNPFIDHRLLDISLNSVSKYSARCLGSLKDYIKTNSCLPPILTFALAALIAFYNGEYADGKYLGRRENGDFYEIRDNADVLKSINSAFKTENPVYDILKDKSLWGEDLTEIEGLCDKVNEYYNGINDNGAANQLKKVINDEYAV